MPPAEAQVRVFDLKVAPVKVGYIMGSGDQVPDALRRMGLSVTELSDEALGGAELSGFDTIVVGIRASEARPDFVANNGRLLDFVKNGGTLVVQYQQPDYAAKGLAPFPVQIGVARDRPDRAGHDPRAGTSGVHHAEHHHGRPISPTGSRNGTCTRSPRSTRSYTPLLETADPGEPSTAGWRGLREDRQGAVRLHGVRVVQAAAGRRAWRLPAVREPGESGREAIAVWRTPWYTPSAANGP